MTEPAARVVFLVACALVAVWVLGCVVPYSGAWP